MAWYPDPLPTIQSPPPLPMARHPNSVTIVKIAVITVGRIPVIIVVIGWRRQDDGRNNNDPETMIMVTGRVPVPGRSKCGRN